MTLPNHPAVEVFAGEKTNRDQSVVSIPVLPFATHRLATDLVRERKSRYLSAAVPAPVLLFTELGAFRCIDTVQADTLSVDFNGVAVNDGSGALDGLLG